MVLSIHFSFSVFCFRYPAIRVLHSQYSSFHTVVDGVSYPKTIWADCLQALPTQVSLVTSMTIRPTLWSNTSSITKYFSKAVALPLSILRVTPRKSVMCEPDARPILLWALWSNNGAIGVNSKQQIHFVIIGAPTVPLFGDSRTLRRSDALVISWIICRVPAFLSGFTIWWIWSDLPVPTMVSTWLLIDGVGLVM